MAHPHSVPLRVQLSVRYSGIGSRDFVTTPNLEIENVDALTKPFWTYLNGYLQEKFNILPGSHECPTLYLDTLKFDVFRSGLTLRDRPSAISSDGERFGDELSVKSRHPDFIEYAKQLTQALYPRHDMTAFMPYVRNEIVQNHAHSRAASKYTYDDFPPEIQAAVEERLGTRSHTMEFWPKFLSYAAPRHRYTVFLDPHDACNFILPAPAETGELKSDKYVCVEVAMDRCVYRRPPQGLPICEILKVPSVQSGRFPFLGADYLAEREFKAGLSGPRATDEMMVAAYMRLGMFFYDLAKPFEGKDRPEPIRAARSKAARGIGALADIYPGDVPRDLISVCHLIP